MSLWSEETEAESDLHQITLKRAMVNGRREEAASELMEGEGKERFKSWLHLDFSFTFCVQHQPCPQDFPNSCEGHRSVQQLSTPPLSAVCPPIPPTLPWGRSYIFQDFQDTNLTIKAGSYIRILHPSPYSMHFPTLLKRHDTCPFTVHLCNAKEDSPIPAPCSLLETELLLTKVNDFYSTLELS